MTAEKFQQLKKRIEESKTKKARAEGSMDEIKKRWKEEHGVSTVAEVEGIIRDLGGRIEDLEKKKERHESDIEKALAEIEG